MYINIHIKTFIIKKIFNIHMNIKLTFMASTILLTEESSNKYWSYSDILATYIIADTPIYIYIYIYIYERMLNVLYVYSYLMFMEIL
jgi:hypothetical protein